MSQTLVVAPRPADVAGPSSLPDRATRTPFRALCDITATREREDRSPRKDPKDPIDRMDRQEPIEPIDSTEPTEPIERTDPFEPIERKEFSEAHDQRDDRVSATVAILKSRSLAVQPRPVSTRA